MAWGFGWGQVGVVGLGCLASSDVNTFREKLTGVWVNKYVNTP